MEVDEVRLGESREVPKQKEKEGDSEDIAVKTVFSTTHLVVNILDIVKEMKRNEVCMRIKNS